MTHKKLNADEQVLKITGALNSAPLLIEVLASSIGKMASVEKDLASAELISIIAQMDELLYTRYETTLAKAMGLGDAQLRKQVKATLKAEKDEGGNENVFYTFGGVVKDYVLEYIYDDEAEKAKLAWRDPSGKVEEGYSVMIDGKKYVPHPVDAIVQSKSILYPSRLGEKKDMRTLVMMIMSFLNRNFLYHDKLMVEIQAYWAFLTWMFDCFPAIPMLRAAGEFGGGKSEMMLRLGLICNKRFVASGAGSTSSLFRIMQVYNFPTLFLDEMDQKNSEAASDIAKLLNQGTMADGAPITRTAKVIIDGREEYQPEVYKVYCPKMLAMQFTFFDQAILSRCMTVQVQPSEPLELKAAHIVPHITDDMKREAQALRNLMLRWRLENWGKRDWRDEYWNVNISARLNQVTWPLLALTEGTENVELRGKINAFMEEYYRFMTQDKNMTIEARIIEAMWTIYKFPDTHAEMVERESDGREKIKIGHIAKVANQIIKAMNMDDEEDEEEDEKDKSKKTVVVKKEFRMTAQKVGKRLRNKLQIETSDRASDGYSAYWDPIHMEALAKRYGIDITLLGPMTKTPDSMPEPAVKQPVQTGFRSKQQFLKPADEEKD